jgi:hypothetical protein
LISGLRPSKSEPSGRFSTFSTKSKTTVIVPSRRHSLDMSQIHLKEFCFRDVRISN